MFSPLRPLLIAAIGTPCGYCRVPMAENGKKSTPSRDHILPRCEYQDWTEDDKLAYGHHNRALVCRSCNHDKGSLHLVEWHTRLVAKLDFRAHHVAAFMEELRARAPAIIAYRILNGRYPPRITATPFGIVIEEAA